MSERLRNVLTVSAIVLIAVVVVFLILGSPTEPDRVESIGARIKCPVCQGESIGDSPADMARDMMNLVEERVAGGFSDQEIVDELLSSYSGAVLLDPPTSGNTLFLWVAPFLVLAAGAGVIVWWRRHPGAENDDEPSEPSRSSRRIVGAVVLVASIAGAVAIAGFSLQERDDSTAGIADQQIDDLDDVSNETLEAVIAANVDHPQINGMRLALAERYYTVNDYRSAFPHYLTVAQSAEASSDEAFTALIRLGWMAWDGNGEAEASVALFDEALEINPASSTASYLKAQVVWCGLGDLRGAGDILENVLTSEGLPEDSKVLVEADLASIRAGQSCQ